MVFERMHWCRRRVREQTCLLDEIRENDLRALACHAFENLRDLSKAEQDIFEARETAEASQTAQGKPSDAVVLPGHSCYSSTKR